VEIYIAIYSFKFVDCHAHASNISMLYVKLVNDALCFFLQGAFRAAEIIWSRLTLNTAICDEFVLSDSSLVQLL
jgi:hypothetical protein